MDSTWMPKAGSCRTCEYHAMNNKARVLPCRDCINDDKKPGWEPSLLYEACLMEKALVERIEKILNCPNMERGEKE